MTLPKRDTYIVLRAPDVSDPLLPSVGPNWRNVYEDARWSSQVEPVDQTPGVDTNTPFQYSTWAGNVIVQADPPGSLRYFVVTQRVPGDNREGLDRLAGSGGNAWARPGLETWQMANAGDAEARAVIRHHTDWRVTGARLVDEDGNPANIPITSVDLRILVPDGPAPRIPNIWAGGGPWHLDRFGTEVVPGDPSEVLRVDTWHVPAFVQAIAGFDDSVTDEPPVEAFDESYNEEYD